MFSHRGSGYIAMAAALWGFIPVISKSLYASGVDPLVAATFRATLAALVFFVISAIRSRHSLRIKWRDVPFFMLFGLLSVVGMYCFFFLAVAHIPISMATVLLYTAPAWVILLSWAVLREAASRSRIVSFVVACVGCFLVVRAYDARSLALNLEGILYGLGSGLSYAMLSVLGKIGLRRYSPLTNTSYALLFGAGFMWIVRPPSVLFGRAYSVAEWSGFWALAVFCTVLPNLLYVTGLRSVEAGRASILATLEPVVSTTLAMLLFRETLEAAQWFGMAMVFSGICLPFMLERGRLRGSSHIETL